MKKSLWEKTVSNCEHSYCCDCGQTLLCEHPDGEEGICEKTYCPIFKIHFVKTHRGRRTYICQGACGTTKEKSTRNIDEVTCKSCLKLLEKREEK